MEIPEFLMSWFEVKVVLETHKIMAYIRNAGSIVGTVPSNCTVG